MRLRTALLAFTLLAGSTAVCAQTVRPTTAVAPARSRRMSSRSSGRSCNVHAANVQKITPRME